MNWPYSLETSTPPADNPLTKDLNGAKYTVEVNTEEVNPLKRDLSPPKYKVDESVITDVEVEEEIEPEVKQTGTGKPSGAGPAASGPGKPYEKSVGSYEETAEWLLKIFDDLASRGLKHLAKDKTTEDWELNEKQFQKLMEWCTECTTYYDFKVSSPLYGLAISLFIVYSDKATDAWGKRKLNEKIAKQEEEILYWKNKAGAGENVGVSQQEIEELLTRMRNFNNRKTTETQQAQPPQKNKVHVRTKNYKAETVEVVDVENEDDFETEEETAKREEREYYAEQERTQNARKARDDEFNLQNQIKAEFFGKNGNNEHNSTANAVENNNNSTFNKPQAENLNGRVIKLNTQPTKKPTAESGFEAVEGSENIASDANGKLEPFEPLKGDKRNRQTEIIRCPMTRKLFERFTGQNKTFINHEAKNMWNYWKRLEQAGQEPKGGFPAWWNTG